MNNTGFINFTKNSVPREFTLQGNALNKHIEVQPVNLTNFYFRKESGDTSITTFKAYEVVFDDANNLVVDSTITLDKSLLTIGANHIYLDYDYWILYYSGRYYFEIVTDSNTYISNIFYLTGTKQNNPFSIEVTMGAGETMTLPFVSGSYTHMATIDWGDGTTPTALTAYNVGNTHTYTSAGTYTISIEGTIETWSFNNGGSKLKIKKVLSWGASVFKKLDNAFYGCSNITEIAGGFFYTGNSLSGFCRDCTNLITFDTSDLDLTTVATMSYFIYNCSKLVSINTSNWNTSNVITFERFAQSASIIAAFDTSGWDTSKVTNFIAFIASTIFTSGIDTSNWDTSSVTTFNSFAYNSRISTFDTSNWDMSKVTDLSGFGESSRITTINTANWDVSNVTTFASFMASNAYLTAINTTNWNVSKVTTMARMFQNCSNIVTIDTSNWVTTALTNCLYSFYVCTKLTTAMNANAFWNNVGISTYTQCFYLSTLIANYASIPAGWK